jgi:HEAT repeat protein
MRLTNCDNIYLMSKTILPQTIRRARSARGFLAAALLSVMAAAVTPALAQNDPEPNWLDLAHKLDSSQKTERIAAVKAAAALGQQRVAAYLRPILTGDKDREVRIEVVTALRTVPGEDAVALLGEGLVDGDRRVRKAVVDALRVRREDSAIPQLTQALSDQRPELRAYAALALGSRLDADRAKLLLGGLDDRDASVREASIYALGAVGGETAVEALAAVVAGDDNKKIKTMAAEVLSAMGSRSALPALVSALDSADKDVLRPALETAIKKILAQTPARVKDEKNAPREGPRPEPKPTAEQDQPTAAIKSSAAPGASEATAKARPVEFKLKAPQARSVLLSMNSLAGKRKVMVRSVDGTWSVSLPLGPGSYRYQFIVDGIKTLDPENAATDRGVSLLKVP